MAALSFLEARETVQAQVRAARVTPGAEEVSLEAADGRVLAEDVAADRDQPPLDRSMRDGYAVQARDLPGALQVAGEVRAGERYGGSLRAGQAIEIMTGAPVPAGADAVVMVEDTRRVDGVVHIAAPAEAGQNVDPRGSQAAAGEVLLRAGERLDFAGVALLAAVGRTRVAVYRKPTVAIVSTGDEIVGAGEAPEPHQIRNSNAYSLAAQVARAGGEPRVLPLARDTVEQTAAILRDAFACDLVLISGGVSAGKYDVVETVLASFGAEFYFDGVRIQPGKPLVFGRACGRFVFGLPGNPGSTMVTFAVFARAALELLAGQCDAPLHMPWARLTREFRQKTGLTRFLPARLSADGSEIAPLDWRGSGDLPALARANAFLVTEPDRPVYGAGDWIQVLVK